MKKYILILLILLMPAMSHADTNFNYVSCLMGSNLLSDAETEGDTFTCVKVSNSATVSGCADTATGLCRLSVMSAACSSFSSCATSEIVTVKAVSLADSTYTFTVKARDQETSYGGRTHSGDWAEGSKVQLVATAQQMANKAEGAASSTDNAIVRFDGTTGKIIQDYTSGTPTISDTGAVSISTTLSLPVTTASTVGVIRKGADRFIHDFHAAGTAANNTFVGINAGNFTMATEGIVQPIYNTGIGWGSLSSLTTGWDNVSVGSETLSLNTTGNSNTAVGESSLGFNVSGHSNTAVGAFSLYANSVGDKNVSIGTNSLFNNIGSNNTVTGYEAGYGVEANSFSNNSLFGYQAGYGLTTGSNNILIGYGAGHNLTTGANNIIIGYDIHAASATANSQLNIGGVITSTDIAVGNISILGDLTVTGGDITGTASGLACTTCVAATELASADFGDFSCNGTTCALDSLSVAAGVYAAASIDGDDVNSNLAGRSLTLNAASPDTLDADAELYTDSIGFNLENPAIADNGKFSTYFSLASTITKVYCSVDSGTVTINLNERALATPDTTGTDVLSAGLVCDTDTQTSCASGCDVNTITNAGIDTTDPLALEIDGTSGSPTILRVTVVFTKDD